MRTKEKACLSRMITELSNLIHGEMVKVRELAKLSDEWDEQCGVLLRLVS